MSSPMLKRVLRTSLKLLLAVAALTYASDYLVFRYRERRGTAFESVTVYRYYSIAKKANRVEYDYINTELETCTRTLFPYRGLATCWYLKRHTEQQTEI